MKYENCFYTYISHKMINNICFFVRWLLTLPHTAKIVPNRLRRDDNLNSQCGVAIPMTTILSNSSKAVVKTEHVQS